MNSLNSSQTDPQPQGQLFDVFLTVFVEGQATPAHMGTTQNVPLSTENAFRALLQKMFPGIRKAGLAVLRPKNAHLIEIPSWVGSGEFYFTLTEIATVRSKGPSPDYPKVVEFNGVKHRLKSKSKKKPISRRKQRASVKRTPGKRKRKATVQKRKATPKAARRSTTKGRRKSNKRK